MCAVVLWLWVCFAGGIGLLAEGEWTTGTVAIWFVGGVRLWNWTVEDWAVAGRIAFAALGGAAILAYVLRRFMSAESRARP